MSRQLNFSCHLPLEVQNLKKQNPIWTMIYYQMPWELWKCGIVVQGLRKTYVLLARTILHNVSTSWSNLQIHYCNKLVLWIFKCLTPRPPESCLRKQFPTSLEWRISVFHFLATRSSFWSLSNLLASNTGKERGSLYK